MDKIYYYRESGCWGDKGNMIRLVEALQMHFSNTEFVRLDKDKLEKNSAGKRSWPVEEKAVMIWGSGHYHQASYYFSPDQSYSKSVDDAHCDLLYCHHEGQMDEANHNNASIRLDDHLLNMEVMGVQKWLSNDKWDSLSKDYKHEVRVSPYICTLLQDETIHKSIDLDVLKNYPCGEFMLGIRSYETVLHDFKRMLRTNNVVRLDIGGFMYSESIKFGAIMPQTPGVREYIGLIEAFKQAS